MVAVRNKHEYRVAEIRGTNVVIQDICEFHSLENGYYCSLGPRPSTRNERRSINVQ
jgi:hypothetical protein